MLAGAGSACGPCGTEGRRVAVVAPVVAWIRVGRCDGACAGVGCSQRLQVVIVRRVCFRYVAARYHCGLACSGLRAALLSTTVPYQQQRDRKGVCAVSVRSGARRAAKAVVAAAAATAVAKGSGRTFEVVRWEETKAAARRSLPNCKRPTKPRCV